MLEDRMTSFGVVILGAGASRRMGQPKMLLPWGDTTVLGSLIEQWRRLGATQIAVVIAKDDAQLEKEVLRAGRASIIENASPERGMFSSVQAASQWPNWLSTHYVIALGDQPQLPDGTLRRILDFARQNPTAVSQPSVKGRGRHPIVLPREVFLTLKDSAFTTLKEHLDSSNALRSRIEMNDPALDVDLDTPNDYEMARARFAVVKAVLIALVAAIAFCGMAAEQPRINEYRGQIVCLPEEMHRLYSADLPTGHSHLYGLRGEDAQYYTILRTRLSEAIFIDQTLRSKNLSLKARLLPKSQILDVTAIRSIKDGKLHDLYYYCDVCDIESVSPAECACCQGPVVLIEKPFKE